MTTREKRLQYQREWSRRRYQARKAERLCTTCGSPDRLIGMDTCDNCLLRMSINYTKRRITELEGTIAVQDSLIPS